MPTKYVRKEVNKVPSRDGKSAHWSEKQKLEAVALWKMVGNLRAVAQSLDIPEDTIRKWRATDWWKQMDEELSEEGRVIRGKKLDKLFDLASNIIEDRLEKGEIYLDKDGNEQRRPANAFLASKVLATAVDKQVLYEKLTADRKKVESVEKIADRLAFLHSEMHRFAKSKEIPGRKAEVIDVEPQLSTEEGGDPESTVNPETHMETTDAVHEEREA